ncbi:MAG: DUF4294 domain-containing protein [Prevotellaceae bacterium]|nr:DUF4294 domain-containing protein [Candidatus Colivivens caballi]
MYKYILTSLLLLFAASGFMRAQVIVANTDMDRAMAGSPIFSHFAGRAPDVLYEGEMIPSVVLGDVFIFAPLKFKSQREAKKYYKIANNIKKVYPIAVEIQHRIEAQMAHIDSLPNKRAKDEYIKKMEKELRAEYTPRMKKLTLSQGKLLIKLIDRQLNQPAFQLIKTYMGGLRAGAWQFFAWMAGASLKKEYDPEVDDRLTERCILLIESGQM